MSKINLTFKGKKYSIDRSLLAGAVAELEAVLGGLNSGGDDYNHDDPALHPTAIQEGAVYLNANSGVYSEMPATVTPGDVYLYQDYMYAYGLNHMDGWQVALATDNDYGYWNRIVKQMFGAPLVNVLAMLGADFNLVPIDQTSYRAILESINGVPVIDMTGAFFECNALVQAPTIPNSVTTISNDAFYQCSSLTSITIPEGVTSIGEYAFYRCKCLTSVTIPESVTSIGNLAFYNCDSLNTVTIPDGVTYIGEFAFDFCYALTSITIPNSVNNLNEQVFSNCEALTSITIPDSVTSIGEKAFSDCRSLTDITFDGTVSQWNSISFGSGWNEDVPATYVQCSDGQVAL